MTTIAINGFGRIGMDDLEKFLRTKFKQKRLSPSFIDRTLGSRNHFPTSEVLNQNNYQDVPTKEIDKMDGYEDFSKNIEIIKSWVTKEQISFERIFCAIFSKYDLREEIMLRYLISCL